MGRRRREEGEGKKEKGRSRRGEGEGKKEKGRSISRRAPVEGHQ